MVFSLISLIFQVFFESTPFVVLSTEYVTNSFGLYTKYVNPTILSGMFKSFLIMDSYLNVVFTSFMGVLIIKIISIFSSIVGLYFLITLKFLNHIKYLEGFLHVCAGCKKIQVEDSWIQIEEYISRHSQVKFSHSMCPDCIKEYYPEFYKDPNRTE